MGVERFILYFLDVEISSRREGVIRLVSMESINNKAMDAFRY